MKVVKYRIAKIFINVVDGCIIIIHEVIMVRFYFNETVFDSVHLILSVLWVCFLKEKSLCLGTSYKIKDVFLRSSYYYSSYEKPAWDEESHSLHVKMSDFAPFRGSYVRDSSYHTVINSRMCIQFAREDVRL